MKLFSFLQTLLTEGRVTVEGQLTAFEKDDLNDASGLLEHFYEVDKLQMPSVAPAFDAAAAIWAAQQVYLSLQLIVLRDIDEATINNLLKPYEAPLSPEVIYSADLVLRYIPDILLLAKGLAPADIMVRKINETAARWPFSSAGMSLQEAMIDDSVIMGHPSLKTAYIDRIIKAKDLTRIINNEVKESVREALGNYTAVLWPAFFESSTITDTCITTKPN